MRALFALAVGLILGSALAVAGPKANFQSSNASLTSGTNTGDVSLGSVGSTPAAAGASLSGQVLTLQPASGTHPGVVTTGTQTMAGAKTFSTSVSSPRLDASGSTGAINLNYGGAAGPYGLNIADAHIYHTGGGELAYIMFQDSTAGVRDYPKWSLGRIVEGGVGESNYRLCYEDLTFGEQCHFVWEGRTGTWATVGSGKASSAEGYTYKNAVHTSWRINDYPTPRYELGYNSAHTAAGSMSCAAGVITVNTTDYSGSAVDHEFLTGMSITQSPATDSGEKAEFVSTFGTDSPWTITVDDSNTFHFDPGTGTCPGGGTNTNAHVFSAAPDTALYHKSYRTLAASINATDVMVWYENALAIQGGVPLLAFTGTAATNTIESYTAASTTSGTVGAITLKAHSALTANDLLLDVQDSAAAHLFTVDQEGDTVIGSATAGSITIGGETGVGASGSNTLTFASTILSAGQLDSTDAVTAVNYYGTHIKLASATLPTCTSGIAGKLATDATGGVGGKYTKLCECSYDGTTARWENIKNVSAARAGNTTTCPDND